MSTRNALIGAAVATLVAAGTTLQLATASATDLKQPATPDAAQEKHGCGGKNGCHGKDAGKDADAKKDGAKKTKAAAGKSEKTAGDKHACAGKNGCHGKTE